MAHPMAAQAKASEKKRLGRIMHGVKSGRTGGKPWGSSKMYKKTSYPGTRAGSNTSFTISGQKGRKRADRRAHGGVVGKLAKGGSAGKKKHHTTNIVIAAPGGGGGHALGGRGGAPVAAAPRPPIAVRPPVPVRPPIAAGGPPVGAPGLGAPGLGAPPPVRPPMGAGAPPMPGLKRGGAVKKAARGGAYTGYPHSPTKEGENAVSPHANGGSVKKRAAGGKTDDDDDDGKRKAPEGAVTGDDSLDPGRSSQSLNALGSPSATPPAAGATDPNAPSTPPPPSSAPSDRNGGIVRKRQFGGGAATQQPQQGGGLFGMTPPGRQPLPPQQGPATISGRPARPAQPLTVPMPSNLAAYRTRPAPGTMVGFKKGGKVRKSKHPDEAQDRKLIKRMIAAEEKKERKRA